MGAAAKRAVSDGFDDLPFSQACENNKRPILAILRRHLAAKDRVLEIGSGTGQHVVFFASELPSAVWQPSDRRAELDVVRARVARAALANVEEPIALDVDDDVWPGTRFDAVFSANTTHIMSWASVERFVRGVAKLLVPGKRFLLYGPFNYGGTWTSPSNEAFDAFLRRRDPASGIRDFEEVDRLARAADLRLLEDAAMPANNRLLVWQRFEPSL
ncbi:MAG: DUF938 domain-containing protein [Deltaproteobacteria bacterium]|nr:DUF938 domain-containing protein [Deltaproteobacteria bacterium]